MTTPEEFLAVAMVADAMFANLPPDALPDLDYQVGSEGDVLVFVEGGDVFTMREGRRGDGARGRTDRSRSPRGGTAPRSAWPSCQPASAREERHLN